MWFAGYMQRREGMLSFYHPSVSAPVDLLGNLLDKNTYLVLIDSELGSIITTRQNQKVYVGTHSSVIIIPLLTYIAVSAPSGLAFGSWELFWNIEAFNDDDYSFTPTQQQLDNLNNNRVLLPCPRIRWRKTTDDLDQNTTKLSYEVVFDIKNYNSLQIITDASVTYEQNKITVTRPSINQDMLIHIGKQSLIGSYIGNHTLQIDYAYNLTNEPLLRPMYLTLLDFSVFGTYEVKPAVSIMKAFEENVLITFQKSTLENAQPIFIIYGQIFSLGTKASLYTETDTEITYAIQISYSQLQRSSAIFQMESIQTYENRAMTELIIQENTPIDLNPITVTFVQSNRSVEFIEYNPITSIHTLHHAYPIGATGFLQEGNTGRLLPHLEYRMKNHTTVMLELNTCYYRYIDPNDHRIVMSKQINLPGLVDESTSQRLIEIVQSKELE